ncbi:MAG: protein translocase subunit SecD [Candidatus Binatia bacterium]
MTNSSLMYRALLFLGLTVIAVLCILPTVVQPLPSWLGFLSANKVSLGLDLQGGTHLILTVDSDAAVTSSVEVNADELRRELRKAGIRSAQVARVDQTTLTVTVPADQRDQMVELAGEMFPNFKLESSETADGNVVQRLALLPSEVQRIKQAAVEQSLETIRNRIDQFGVSEPVIQRQGERDILVQLPGIQDPERAKELIGKTAVLSFKLVREGDAEALAKGSQPIPAGTEVLYELSKVAGSRQKGQPLLVETQTLMTGDVVVEARVRPGDLPNSRIVSLDLNARGARLFEEITAANVNRRLAIVLDNTIYSAPVIKERIPGGRAVISGSFTSDEARDLSIVLRTGALPAPVSIAEERTVGPSLGQDSIDKGIRSFVVGGLLVILFMLVYYRFAGLLADLALVWNILFLVATLAVFQATLTLPGIAGVVLTLGMAVDANVLINERIREELRLGKSARAAIEAGYERALPSILDSNITTFLSGVILFQFGSGPIKGFAVTLCIGLVSSVFTAVVGTRLVWDYLLSRQHIETVSI